MTYKSKDSGTSYAEVVWKTINSIREKALKEYRTPQKKLVVHGNWSETIIEPDSKKEFIQGCEFLSDILVQEFSPDLLKDYNKVIEDIEEKLKEFNKDKIKKEDYVLFKLESMRKVLRIVMIHLKGANYLKIESWGDDDSEEIVEDED